MNFFPPAAAGGTLRGVPYRASRLGGKVNWALWVVLRAAARTCWVCPAGRVGGVERLVGPFGPFAGCRPDLLGVPCRASPLDGEVCGALWEIADWCLYTFVHIKQQDAIRVLLFYASMMKISSMGTEKTWAIRQARTREGLYRPFSRLPMVSRRTPTRWARSSWVMLYLARYSFSLVWIIGQPPTLSGDEIELRQSVDHHGHSKACSQTGDQGLTALLALEEEGPGGCERALLRTALYFKNLVPKKMHGPLIRECREAGIVV